jgi:hypothetical protein
MCGEEPSRRSQSDTNLHEVGLENTISQMTRMKETDEMGNSNHTHSRIINPIGHEDFMQSAGVNEVQLFNPQRSDNARDRPVFLHPSTLGYSCFSIQDGEQLTKDRVTERWARNESERR